MGKLVGADISARAVAFLRAHGDPTAADLLAACAVEVVLDEVGDIGLELVGPLATQAGPLDLDEPMARTLAHALRAAVPPSVWIERLWARPADEHGEPLPVDADASDAAPTTRLATTRNQAARELTPRTWAGMRFRSESEVAIAQALDRAGVLFLPGALARLGTLGARQNREADFLVCANGTWGILEVDGEPFHTEAQRADDVARDRLFRQHGIRVIEHYDAERCTAAPDAVVAEFLAALTRPRPE